MSLFWYYIKINDYFKYNKHKKFYFELSEGEYKCFNSKEKFLKNIGETNYIKWKDILNCKKLFKE